MIYEHFRATGAYAAVQGLSDVFNIRFQDDDVQDFDTRWDQALSAPSEKWPWRVSTSQKLHDAVQLQTVLAVYEQKNIRNNEQPSCSRLKTTARRNIDQTMRTRNFRARNERVERGGVTKSQKKRRKSQRAWIGRWENAISDKQLDSVQKETHVVSVMIQCLEKDAIRDKKDNRPLLHQKRRHRPTDRYPRKVQAAEGRVFLEQEAGFRAEISSGEKCTNPSCNFWHPPVCLNYKSESGCTFVEKCRFRHVEADGHPSKKSKKSGVEVQLSYKRSLHKSEKFHSTERRKIGIQSHRQILQGHVAPHENSRKKGSIARRHSKV